MIQPIRNTNNVSFKSIIGHDTNHGPFPQDVKSLIEAATNNNGIDSHIENLDRYFIDIHLAALYDKNGKPTGKFGFFKDIGDVVTHEEEIDSDWAIVGKVETTQDAQLLLEKAISKAWSYVIEHVMPHMKNVTYH